MQRTRHSPRWWTAWMPLLLVGGTLALESQVPLSPGGHQIMQIVMTPFMFGILMFWLRCKRGALINEAYEREQKEGVYKHMHQRRAAAMSDDEPWEDA
jgi:hypothetical protein